jgi:secreted Zn-dependent insulinase-like peptidase
LLKILYEQFTNSAAKAKDALVKGVNKLSDIDLEVLKKKDTGEYKFLSKKAEIQEVENLEKTQMTAFDQANIIRQGIEQLETSPVTGTNSSSTTTRI